MKFTVTAGAFANALALATLLGDDRRVKKNQALEAVHLTPDGASVKISANVLDHAVELTLSAVVEEGGTLALSGARLAALAGGFPSKAEITIQADGPTARVACDRSHFRLPAIAVENLPARPTLAEENGCVELAREEAIALFARPLFARPSRRATIFAASSCTTPTTAWSRWQPTAIDSRASPFRVPPGSQRTIASSCRPSRSS